MLLIATPLLAGIRYEFRETSRTEETAESTQLVARVVMDGEMSRIEVVSGNKYQPGSYMITHGDERVYVIYPDTKSYLEYTTGSSQLNSERVQITNPKVSFAEVPGDSPVIAGYPTRHYQLRMTYDITIQMGTITISQIVDTLIDKWTTSAFDHLIGQYEDNIDELKTGNPGIDALIDAEATKFSGLPLRQLTQIITRGDDKKKNPNNPLPSTRKRTTEMVVSKIEEAQVSPNLFAIPVDFTKGAAAKAPGTTTQYLTMKPEGQ